MFIITKTPETTDRYSRLLANGHLANVGFLSFENPAFVHSYKRNGENYKYQYIADFEFIDYLSTITNKPYPHQYRVLICIDDFPEEVKGLLRMNSDVVGAFKAVFNDLQLDQLAKEV